MEIAELKTELEKLHQASFGWTLSCCRRNHADAEEVLQTVYLKILQGKAVYRGECKLQTWLFAVIRKTAISERRKHILRTLKSIAVPESRPDERNLKPASSAPKSSSASTKRWHDCRRANAKRCTLCSTRI